MPKTGIVRYVMSTRASEILVLAVMQLSFKYILIQRRLHGIVALYIAKLEEDVGVPATDDRVA